VAAAGGLARRLHARRISAQQRLHLAALLIALAALPAAGQDIHFNNISPSDFAMFSRTIAQGIYADPVQPARSSGILHFDAGLAATLVHVDQNAQYWKRAVGNNNFVQHGGYVGVPRLVVAKGWGGGTLSGSYAKITKSGIKTYGGALDLPIIRGGLVSPELALRAAYARLAGVRELKLKTYGVEAFLSKGFGPLTPYAAVGRMRADATGSVDIPTQTTPITMKSKSDVNRYTAGVRISLFVPKLVVEATQAEQRSYAAKISIGF
jgi:hypothetical protein